MAMTATPEARQNGRGWRLRLGILTILTTVLSALAATTGTGTAHAEVCQSEPAGDYSVVQNDHLYVYFLLSDVETFGVADSRVVTNALDQPVSVTITGAQSKTFTLFGGALPNFPPGVFGFFEKVVGPSFEYTHTTRSDVPVTFTVPAHGEVRAEYGIVLHNVAYYVDVFRVDSNRCWFESTVHLSANDIPTDIEEWRLS